MGVTWGKAAMALLAGQSGKAVGRGCDIDNPTTSTGLAWCQLRWWRQGSSTGDEEDDGDEAHQVDLG